jgi:hypothetical protein
VTLHGGGLSQPLKGRVRVARALLAGVRTATTRFGGVSLREVTVNGQPGAMVLDPSERLIGVVALDIAERGQMAFASHSDPKVGVVDGYATVPLGLGDGAAGDGCSGRPLADGL